MARDVKSILLVSKKLVGSNARLAERLKLSEKTVQDWLSKESLELDRLSPEKKSNIFRLASELGIELDLESIGPPLWNPDRSFEENSRQPIPDPPQVSHPFADHRVKFLGFHIGSPVGVGSSILTSNVGQIRFWAASGVSVITKRSVRSFKIDSLPPPNLYFPVNPIRLSPDLDSTDKTRREIEVARSWNPALISNGIVSHFQGNSPDPTEWEATYRTASLHIDHTQVLIQSIIGGRPNETGEAEVIADWVATARLAIEAGAKVIELNLSAPPSVTGNCPPVCFYVPLAARICAAVSREVGDAAKLLIKIRRMPEQELTLLVGSTIGEGNAHGVSAVNSEGVRAYIQTPYHKFSVFGGGEVCLAGKPLLESGLRCVGHLANIRQRLGLKDMAIVASGGVTDFTSFLAYLQAGANVVQVTTQCFADSYFPYKLRKQYDDEGRRMGRVSSQDEDLALMNFAKAARQVEQWPGMTLAKRDRVVAISQDEMIQWMRRRDATSALGPMRTSVPTMDECVRLIQAKLI